MKKVSDYLMSPSEARLMDSISPTSPSKPKLAIDFVMDPAVEGGLADHPKDPGGRTNMGITQVLLNSARLTMPGLPAKVDDLTRADCESIYEVFFWKVARCDYLPDGPAIFTFDSAVQHSPSVAVKFLQRALGLPDDGSFGPATKTAVAQVQRWNKVLAEMMARRMHFYMQLHNTNDTFGLGWARRLTRVYDAAKAML